MIGTNAIGECRGMTEEQPVVFVIDDDGMVRDAVKDLLCSVGLRVESFGSTQGFLRSKRSDAPSCIVLRRQIAGGERVGISADPGRIGYPASSHIH